MCLSVAFGINSKAQEILNLDSLNKNESSISLEVLKGWAGNNGGVFFCSNDYPIFKYENQMNLFEKSKIDSAQPPCITFMLFYEQDQISKNPFLQKSGFQDSIINQVEFYLVCSNSVNVKRALNLFQNNFRVINQIEDIYQVGLKGICPVDIPHSISLYYDLIYEVFNPQYSLEEKLELQTEIIEALTNNIKQLDQRIKQLEENQEDMKAVFDALLLQLEPKKRN